MRDHAEELILHRVGLHQFLCSILHDALERVGMQFQGTLVVSYLTSQLVRLNSPAQGSHHVVAIDGFLNEVVGTASQGLYRKIVLAVTRDQQGRRLRSQGLYLCQQGQSIHAWHLDIAHDGIVFMLLDLVEHEYDAIVSDIKMPGMDGLPLLAKIQALRPETPTLLITGHGEHDLAIQALRGGAYDFIQKPIDRDYVVAALRRAIQTHQLRRQVRAHQRALEMHAPPLERALPNPPHNPSQPTPA